MGFHLASVPSRIYTPGLTVFDTDGGLRDAQPGVGREDDLRRLLPQERYVLQCPVRRQDQQPGACLVFAQTLHAHVTGW